MHDHSMNLPSEGQNHYSVVCSRLRDLLGSDARLMQKNNRAVRLFMPPRQRARQAAHQTDCVQCRAHYIFGAMLRISLCSIC